MTEHMEEHHFCCGECLMLFTCPFLVPIHFQLEHELRCVCDRSFSEKAKLLTHMENDGCRFPFSVEVSNPAVTQHLTTERKSKFKEAKRSLPDGVFDAVDMCIRKTDSGFSCGICEKVSTSRFHVWQHIKERHNAVVKKVTSWHLKTVVQKYCVMVGEAWVCTVCGKPYVKRFNFYEHVCVEHKREISQITVDPAKVEEQDTEEKSALPVLCNRLYIKHKEGMHRCLICRSCRPSLQDITKHLRKHGKKLKECLDKIVKSAALSKQKMKNIQSPRKYLSYKYNTENVKLKTENDGSGLSQKLPASVHSEVVVKRPELELEFLRGYIAKKEAFYYCQLCPARSKRKGYLYQHLEMRHDDILGDTLSTLRENETKLFERKDTSECVRSPVAQNAAGILTHSLGNVVGNVEFHTVQPSENNRYNTRSMLFSESSDRKRLESQSFSKHASSVSDYRLVKVENVDEFPSPLSHNISSVAPPNFNDGELSATPRKRRLSLQPVSCDDSLTSNAVGRRVSSPLRKKPELSPLKSPEVSYTVIKNVSEVSRAFCAKTGTYVCSICKHRLISKSGWYKHYKQCRTGQKFGLQKNRNLSSKRSVSGDKIQFSESALDQGGSYLPVVSETSKVKRKEGYDQKMWRCVACQCQFASYSGWQRHFSYCKRKHFTAGKRRRGSKSDIEFLRKYCCRKGRKFACRICGLNYTRIYDTFSHLRLKHSLVDMASGDDADLKLCSVSSQPALNRSPAKVTSELKSSVKEKPGLNSGLVKKSGLKRTLDEAALTRRAFVRSQILEENERFFCQICGQSFLLKSSARKHINRKHLGTQKNNRQPTTGNSSVDRGIKNVASARVNRLKVKLLYKSRNNNFAKGAKASVSGSKLKTEVGRTALMKSCGVCSKRFLSLQNLTSHVASEHMTIKTTPFPCMMCPRHFERRQYCVKHFVYKHCLDTNSKTVGRKFYCKICNVFFPNKTCRLQHLSEVHADVCEKCSLCSAVFLTKQDLKKHVHFMHSAKLSDVSEGQLSSDVLRDQVSRRDSEVQVGNGILSDEAAVPIGQVQTDLES